MLKSELAAKIAEKHGLFQRDADAAVTAILDAIEGALARGERVELRDFRDLHGEAPRRTAGP